MKVRTVTIQKFIKNKRKTHSFLEDFSSNISMIESEFSPRTHRVSCEPFYDEELTDANISKIKNFVTSCITNDIWGCSVPINISKSFANSEKSNIVQDIISSGGFVNLIPTDFSDGEDYLNYNSVAFCSKTILKISEGNPIDNFNLGIASSIPIKTPFFPMANAKVDKEILIGLEIIPRMLDLVKEGLRMDMNSLRDHILNGLFEDICKIEKYYKNFAKINKYKYGGIDLSLAPYPYPLEDQSVIPLIENIGNIGRSRGESLYEFGMPGTIFINSFITDILKELSSRVLSTGFNGVMYSLLEDTYLSKKYSSGEFNIDMLEALTATCGCGIDMVPLKGDVSSNAISGIILDMIAHSFKLQKPLGVRLLPVKSLKIDEETDFRHLFFTNTKIKDIGSGVKLQNFPKQNSKYKFLHKKYKRA